MAKYKKMTNKEFKQAINDCGMYWDNWGYEGIINMVIGFNRMLSKQDEERGFYAIAEDENVKAHKLFMILEERGYYDKEVEGN